MDALLKKYFWILELAIVSIAAFFTASIGSTLISSKLMVLPEIPKIDSPGTPVQTKQESVGIDEVRKANIFNTERQDFKTLDTSVAIKDLAPDSLEPVLSQIRAQLVGTIVSTVPQNSLCVLVDTSTKAPAMYGIGSIAMDDYKITKIERKRVTFKHGSKIEYLEMGDEQETRARAQSRMAKDEAGSGDGVKELSPGKYIVAQSELDSTLTNINQVAMQARIQPNIENGKSNGFKLFSIKPGSIYSKIGLQNGDVVQKINGFEMNSPDKALEIYQKLKEAKHLSIEVNRNGKQMTMDYTIR